MAKAWRCGDCGAFWPMDVLYCRRPFDDYLSLRGGSIEAAMERALRPSLLRLAVVEQQSPHRTWTPTVPVSMFAIAA